jgi:hypothetical protein
MPTTKRGMNDWPKFFLRLYGKATASVTALGTKKNLGVDEYKETTC